MTATLVIGDKNWSTWSLRAWLVLRRAGIAFDETLIRLRRSETKNAILPLSPSGWIPALRINGTCIWESLAIAEWAAEQRPELWPADPTSRALARSVAAEIHAGFAPLRANCPMDLALRTHTELTEAAERDVRRVVALWRELRARPEAATGPWLFGDWSIADAFFTPIATRFRTHGVDLAALGADTEVLAYGATLLSDHDFQAWEGAALADEAALDRG